MLILRFQKRIVQYSIVRHNIIHTIQYYTILYNTIQFNTLHYSTLQKKRKLYTTINIIINVMLFWILVSIQILISIQI